MALYIVFRCLINHIFKKFDSVSTAFAQDFDRGGAKRKASPKGRLSDGDIWFCVEATAVCGHTALPRVFLRIRFYVIVNFDVIFFISYHMLIKRCLPNGIPNLICHHGFE